MQFLSFSFLALITLCFFLYYAVKGRARNFILLAASCIFIGWYYLPFLLTAVVVALFTFFWAQWMENRAKSGKKTKVIYIAGIIGLIGGWLLLHGTVIDDIIFPLGMSFYTFQAIGYLTDVYWQEQRAEKNWVDFLIYMLFFMKFLSGPIERGGDLLPQLKDPRPFIYSNAVTGLKYILLGLIKKLLIANQIAPQTDIMFHSIHDLSGVQLLMTCLLYPIELYADFSGYTDIAIGGAYLFGIKLSPNFNRPFAARSTADFWRRWHMSLSFWVRDYLYVPLTAGTRNWGQWGVYFSLIITFLVLGLWHGSGLTFAIYGLIQGILICWEMKTSAFRNKLPQYIGKYASDSLLIIRTYLLFALSLIFFRVQSLSDAWYFLRNISFEVHSSWKEMNIGIRDHNCIVAGSALLLVLIYEYYASKYNLMETLERQPAWLRWSVYYLLVFALLMLGKFDTETFIYLQF
ncbi:MBOAT family protein [Bacteroides fragilis]|uniref:MBOAT family O-acyltransferase n=1 Tax=Bacteroides sp. TaxID=29523 RepID=UPI002A08B3FC|nr:MBOAT family protein [Bacteroides fragilis]MCS2615633.1 MBOAT family protein [Bacteroides fragilis]MCS2881294.1 MBOAT family protein [Bacteroides fragilis]